MELSRAIDAGVAHSRRWRDSRPAGLPAMPRLTTAFGDAAYRAHAGRSNDDPIPRPLAVHLAVHPDPERLTREIGEVARHFDRDRDVVALQVDATAVGGSRMSDVAALTGSLERHFHFAPGPGRGFVAVLDPLALQPGELAALGTLGFNAIELVADIGATEAALRALEGAREAGLRCAVEVRLPPELAGEASRAGIDALTAARPCRLALSLPGEPRGHAGAAALQFAARLDAAGYTQVGLDPRPLSGLAPAASPWLAGTLGDGTWPVAPVGVDVIGLGIGGVGRVGDCVVQSLTDAGAWAAAIDAGLLPVWRGCVLDTEERLRIDIVEEWLRSGAISIAAVERRYGIGFAGHFSAALQRLAGYAADGLASIDSQAVRATSQGRLLLRIMAECFDNHPLRP